MVNNAYNSQLYEIYSLVDFFSILGKWKINSMPYLMLLSQLNNINYSSISASEPVTFDLLSKQFPLEILSHVSPKKTIH